MAALSEAFSLRVWNCFNPLSRLKTKVIPVSYCKPSPTTAGRLVHSSSNSDVYYKTHVTLPQILTSHGYIAQLNNIQNTQVPISIRKPSPLSRIPVEVLCAGKTLYDYLKIKTSILNHKDKSDDPFFVMNIDQLINRYKLWTDCLPKIKPFFAVKSNNDPIFLSLLANLGTGFDCASKKEIELVLGLGVPPGDIIYAHTAKQISHLRFAHSNNISLMTFDNENELQKIAAEYPNAQCVVRIIADDPTAKVKLSDKFGCSVPQACHLLKKAKDLTLNIVGVSFHAGWMTHSPQAYSTAIEMAHAVFEYGGSIGYKMRLLDIGGGFPGSASEDQVIHFQQIAHAINSTMDKLFGDRKDITVIAEPGQYFAASCFTLVTQIIGKREVVTQQPVDSPSSRETNKAFHYYINDGAYGSFNAIAHGGLPVKPAYALPPVSNTAANSPHYPSVIWGPTCDSFDKVCPDVSLPELSPGDWLVFEEQGAYSLSSRSDFNGFMPPSIRYTSNKIF